MAYDSGNGFEYIASSASDTVDVYNGTKLISTIPVGVCPTGVAYDFTGANSAGTGGVIIVANSGSNTVSVINDSANSVIDTLNVGKDPTAVVADTTNDLSYVVNSGSNTVTMIDDIALTVNATINVGSDPIGAAWDSIDGLNGYIFVANNQGDSVSVIDESNKSVVATVNGIISPFGLAFVGDYSNNDEVYVSSSGTNSNAVYAINASSFQLMSKITVGYDPRGITTNQNSNFPLGYVANYANDSVTVINLNTNTINGTITGINSPLDVSFNASFNYAYVADYLDSTITIITVPSSGSGIQPG